MKFIEKFYNDPLTQNDYHNLIKAYQGVGVSLQFVSYKDLGL